MRGGHNRGMKAARRRQRDCMNVDRYTDLFFGSAHAFACLTALYRPVCKVCVQPTGLRTRTGLGRTALGQRLIGKDAGAFCVPDILSVTTNKGVKQHVLWKLHPTTMSVGNHQIFAFEQRLVSIHTALVIRQAFMSVITMT